MGSEMCIRDSRQRQRDPAVTPPAVAALRPAPAQGAGLRFISNYVVWSGRVSSSGSQNYLPTYAARAQDWAANYLPTQRGVMTSACLPNPANYLPTYLPTQSSSGW